MLPEKSSENGIVASMYVF